MNEIKVSYEQIKKANEEIETIKLGAKGYAQVNERIKAYRKVYPSGRIITTMKDRTEDSVTYYAEVCDENGEIIATGSASEKLTGNDKKDYINISSMVENCETSAVGRALGFAGFGVDSAIASAEDIEKSSQRSKGFEIYKDMFIRDEDAKRVIKVVVGDLMRKMGVVKASLSDVVDKELWTTLEEMTTHQLLRLEYQLKTLNMESNKWHSLYNENLKIKDVVPKNQEVTYESSWYKFGKIALERAGTDELMRNDIINNYLEMGINLEANK